MQQTELVLSFAGPESQRQLAEQIFGLARFQSRFFATTAPITLRRDDLVAFLSQQRKGIDRQALAAEIDAALASNSAIFARQETADGVVSFVTTRAGVAPVEHQEDTEHTLPERFLNPVEIAPPPPPSRPALRIADAWTQRPVFDGLPDDLDGVDGASDDVVVPANGAAEASLATAEPVTSEVSAASPASSAPAPEPVPAPATPVAPDAVGSLADLPVEALRAALAARLATDDRFVAFGDQYYNEDLVDRYSRGDIRRIREYIQEVTEPLADDALLQDLFGRRPNDPAYESARFSINYRLSREKRDFEFVGTRDARLWSIPGLPPIGTTLRKASELGQDYRYLLDEPPAELSEPVTHVLTFFEWLYGLLPLDGALRQIVPPPYLDEQKTAVLRFDAPDLYVSFLVDVRYPTGNRGGYIVGFDEFYREYLVPGAVVTIDRSAESNGQFVIRYARPAQREERLLQIDERRNRYVFRPQAITSQVDNDWLLLESRYPRLANVKPLDDRERRQAALVVGAAFERAAENVGTKAEPLYWSTPEELLPVVNIERPFSLRALREVLESPQFPQFSPDPETAGAFFYEPPAAPAKKPARGRAAAAVDEVDEDEA